MDNSALDRAVAQPQPNAATTRNMPTIIVRDNRFPAKFDEYTFKEAENPRSRVRQFQCLKDNALFQRIKDLPAWQQMQEMQPWFRPPDIILVFLREVERYTIPWSIHLLRNPNTVAHQLHEMGFSGDLVFPTRFIRSSYLTLKANVGKYLAVLASSTPVHIGLGLSTPDVAQTTFSIPGPTTREFTLITEPLDIPGSTKGAWDTAKKACTIARMEFFHDTYARKKLVTLAWSRLRLLDPTLLPWVINETIATKNPQVLHKEHFMQTQRGPLCATSVAQRDPFHA
jgi:hypothetical protein